MRKNNFPQAELDGIEPGTVRELVHSLKQLHDMGRPRTDVEVKERIDEYFSFCERSGVRPGIESLCLSLHISRTTLFRWSHGQDCSEYRQELIQTAKSFIGSFLEQALLCGKISPPSGIFLAKNWLNYRDTISLEDNLPKEEKVITSLTKLPDLRQHLEDIEE